MLFLAFKYRNLALKKQFIYQLNENLLYILSYLSDYFKAEKKYFAENQFVTTINMVDGDFFQNRMMEQDFKKELESNEYIVKNSCYGYVYLFLELV